jgi:hypothetical protein
VTEDLRDQLDLLVKMAGKGKLDLLAPLDQVGREETLEAQAQQEPLDHLVQLDLQGHKDHKVLKETRDKRVSLVNKDLQALQEPQVRLVNVGTLARQAVLELMGQLVQLAQLVQLVNLDNEAKWVLLEILDCRVQQVLKALKVLLDRGVRVV